MVYIVFVNPQILGNAGMDKGAVFVATCIAAAVSTLVMALYANYPIALAPGMGLNAFFAFTVVLGYKYTWQQALAGVFCSGVLFFLISIFRIREYVINSIPKNLKLAISAGVGLFLGIIALEEAKIVVAHPATLVTLGDLKQWPAILCLLGFVLIVALNYRKIIGGTVIGILIVTAIGSRRARDLQRRRLGAAVARADAVQARLLAPRRADLHHRGVQLPAGRHVRQRRHADRRHPPRRPPRQGRQPAAHEAGADRRQLRRHVRRADRHLDHDQLHIESAAGVAAGGRTGLTAVFVALFFLLALFFAPLAGMVPAYASAAALLYVACVMARGLAEIDWDDITEYAPAVVAAVTMPLTYSIATGIGLGFITYALAKIIAGKFAEAKPAVLVLAILFAVKFYWVRVKAHELAVSSRDSCRAWH